MLKRTPAASSDSPSLGDLLVKKAEQGVRVRLLEQTIMAGSFAAKHLGW